MKALSILQPWAWLIVSGHKDIENRTWPTKVRGRVAIHAGKGNRRVQFDGAHSWCWCIGVDLLVNLNSADFRDSLAFGAIIGTVEIIDCVTKSASPWFEGPFGFVLRAPVMFEKPILYKGRLGFFEIGDVG